MPNSTAPLLSFLRAHRVLHLATTGVPGPHATPLVYAIWDEGPDLVWISSPDVAHSRQATDLPTAASIAAPVSEIHHTWGAQLHGTTRCPTEQGPLRRRYVERFPESEPLIDALPTHRFFRLHVTWARLIDTRTGSRRRASWSFPPPT